MHILGVTYPKVWRKVSGKGRLKSDLTKSDSSSSPRDAGVGRGSRRGVLHPQAMEVASSPRPSPPSDGGEGEESGANSVFRNSLRSRRVSVLGRDTAGFFLSPRRRSGERIEERGPPSTSDGSRLLSPALSSVGRRRGRRIWGQRCFQNHCDISSSVSAS